MNLDSFKLLKILIEIRIILNFNCIKLDISYP